MVIEDFRGQAFEGAGKYPKSPKALEEEPELIDSVDSGPVGMVFQ